MQNRFKVGDHVFYAHLASYGTIRSIINANDSEDVSLQGFRYEVMFEKHGLYSVLEKSLARRKENKHENEKTAKSGSAVDAG